MSFNCTCRGASGSYLAAPLRVPPPTPAPDSGPKEVGSGATLYVERLRVGGKPAPT